MSEYIMFGKPNYIPEEFLIATRQGWVDSRTGEILVSVVHLDQKLKDHAKKANPDYVEQPVIPERKAFYVDVSNFPSNVDETKKEPKQGSNEMIADVLSMPSSISITMDSDFGTPNTADQTTNIIDGIKSYIQSQPTTKINVDQSTLSLLDLIEPFVPTESPEDQNSLASLIAPVNEVTQQITESGEQPKRKAGRPKKIVVDNGEPVVKRKAGRPKKNPDV